jgi:cell division protein ZapA (FtsZ GTPase activity inhibitor)
MKTFISLFALFLSLSLTATLHSQIWFFNDSSIYGIETTGNTASGDLSTAMGWETTASGIYSTAMGEGTTASGWAATAMGYQTTASSYRSTAMGELTTASGTASTAMGTSTTASDNSSLVIGHFNLSGSTVTANAVDFSLDNTAFVIGNGAYDSSTQQINRSDALTVLFDGTTTIAGDLNVNSDARLKANIISLGSTLSKLLQIDGKSYTMKKDESEKQKIGLLAQDIEKVFPELISESQGVKSVNYQGLVPVLINALKEQQSEIEILKQQQSEIDELKTMLKTLIEKT